MKRCVAILVGLFLLTPLEALSFAAGKEVAFERVELLDGAVTASCDDDGVLDTGESARLRVTLRNSGTERLKLTSMTLSSTAPDVSFPKGPTANFPPVEPSQSVSTELLVALSGPPTPRDITLNIAYRDDAQTVPGDKTHTVTYRVNTDELLGTRETVESARDPWTVTVPPVGIPSWTRKADETGANRFFHGPNNGVTTDLSLVSPPLQLSATEAFRVIFQHRYAFEASPAGFYFDGAVIELSQDDGKSWADIGAFVSPTYNATLDAGGSNPLKGRRAYGGQSPGYPAFTEATLGLGTTYAGKTVRLRFRIGTDDSTGVTGWDLDNLQLEGVVNTPFTTVVAHRGKCVNRVPVAEAGPDQEDINEGRLVTLSGSGTDPEGTPLTYAWTQTQGPSVTFSDPSASSPTFLAPDVTGDTDLQFELRVSDGVNTSPPDVVTVRVRDASLVARAGEDQVVREGSGVTLNGSGSTAPDDSELTYTWTQVEGPPVNLLLSGPRAMFNAPEVDEETVLTFQLQVKQDGGQTSEDTVTVRVIDRNATPRPSPGGCAAGPEGGVPTAALLLLTVLGFTPRRPRRRSH